MSWHLYRSVSVLHAPLVKPAERHWVLHAPLSSATVIAQLIIESIEDQSGSEVLAVAKDFIS